MLEIAGISVQLGRNLVLDAVSAAVRRGTLVGVIGPNGAGKSSLLKAIAGLVPKTGGTLRLDDQDLGQLRPDARSRLLAYLPQDRSVHWPLSVGTLVGLGRLPHRGQPGNTTRRDEMAVAAALATMDLAHLTERPAGEISGGELARVLMARALAQDTDVLLADEPTAGLDPAHALALLDILKSLSAKGRTILVALHDLSLALRFCDDVIVLANGRVTAAGRPHTVLTPLLLHAVYGAHMSVGVVDGVPAVVTVGPTARPAGA